MNNKAYIIPALVLLVYLSTAWDCQAGLFEQIGMCGTANSLGGAVTAAPPGAKAVHYNPAGLAFIKGTRFDNEMGWMIMNQKMTFDQSIDAETGEPWAPFGGWFNDGIDPFDGAEDRQENPYMIIPIADIGFPYTLAPAGMAVSYTPPEKDNKWSFGNGFSYAPFGGGLRNRDGDPQSYIAKTAWFCRFILAAPAAAYKISDTLSVGMSVPIGVSMFHTSQNLRAPNDMGAMTGALGECTENLEIPVLSELTLPPPWFGGGLDAYGKVGDVDFLVEDYFTTSYNLGLLWKPVKQFAFGMCYQSECETKMTGDYKFVYGERFQKTVEWNGKSPMTLITAGMFDLPYNPVPYQKGTATMEMTWPARFQAGIMIKPIKQIRFTCDASWTQWSSWPEINVGFDQKIQMLRFSRMLGYPAPADRLVIVNNFKDVWSFGYGLEIKPIDKIGIRLGWEPRKSSVRDEYYGFVPFPDMDIYGVGITIVEEPNTKPKPKNLHELNHQLLKPSIVELSVTWIRFDDKFVAADSSAHLNSTNFTKIGTNPVAGLDLKQEFEIWMYGLNQVFRW